MAKKTLASPKKLAELERENKELNTALTNARKVVHEMYADIKRLAFMSTLLVVASISYVLYTI